jgi:hypothetical protein
MPESIFTPNMLERKSPDTASPNRTFSPMA